MGWRGIFWLGIVPVVAGSIALAASRGGPAGIAAFAATVGWGLLGLILEVASAARYLRRPRGVGAPAGARPPDGVVEIARVRGVLGPDNSHDARFRRFEAFEDPAAVEPEPPPIRAALPRLLGRVVFVSIFVGRDGTAWSDAEIARMFQGLRTAGVWIERQAARWGARVNVELAEVYAAGVDDVSEEVDLEVVTEGAGTGFFEAAAEARAIASASRVAARLGFRDAADLVAGFGSRVEADVIVWLLHPRRRGRSLAIAADRGALPGVTLAVCYPRYAPFPGPLDGPPGTDPVTVVHEVLHLFGAEDTYGRPLADFPGGDVGPRDIMRLEFATLSRLRVDLRTAREIGWA